MLEFQTKLIPFMEFVVKYSVYILITYAIVFMVVVLTLRYRCRKTAAKKYPRQDKQNRDKLLDKMYDMNMCYAKAFTYLLIGVCSLVILAFSVAPQSAASNSSADSKLSVITNSAITSDSSVNDDKDIKNEMAQASLAMLTFLVSFTEVCHNSTNSRKIYVELVKKEKKRV